MRDRRRSGRHQQRIRTRASNFQLRSQSSGNNQAQKWNVLMVDLPPEVLDTIIELLPKTDMANLAAVNKAFKACAESKFWRKIRSRIGTPWDTAGLVDLLTVRPDIIPMIRTLVLDEYHPCIRDDCYQSKCRKCVASSYCTQVSRSSMRARGRRER